jgi:hypothetical protein
MKIYPDSELPDVEVAWYEGDCRDMTGEVAITLVGVDTPATRTEQTVLCTTAKVTFADVARERFRVTGTLQDANGNPFTTSESDVDLRDGLDHSAWLYFGGFDNVRVTWLFEAADLCESLAVDDVYVELFTPAQEPTAVSGAPCLAQGTTLTVPDGVYSARAFGLSGELVVAASEPSPEFVVQLGSFVNVDPLVLVACGSACPEP